MEPAIGGGSLKPAKSMHIILLITLKVFVSFCSPKGKGCTSICLQFGVFKLNLHCLFGKTASMRERTVDLTVITKAVNYL